jgi:hypothetical protein
MKKKLLKANSVHGEMEAFIDESVSRELKSRYGIDAVEDDGNVCVTCNEEIAKRIREDEDFIAIDVTDKVQLGSLWVNGEEV